MPFTRESVIAAWLDVVDACANVREAMSSVERSILGGVESLRLGADVLEALSATGVKERREDLDETWRLLAITRHRFRVLLVAHCLANDMDPREISRVWGIDREDVDTLVHEARDLEANYN